MELIVVKDGFTIGGKVLLRGSSFEDSLLPTGRLKNAEQRDMYGELMYTTPSLFNSKYGNLDEDEIAKMNKVPGNIIYASVQQSLDEEEIKTVKRKKRSR